MVTNPLGNKEEGNQVISESDRGDKPDPQEVELVFEEAVEGEEVDINLGFNIGANAHVTIAEIEEPEPGFALVDPIPLREEGVDEIKGEAVLNPSLTSTIISIAEILLEMTGKYNYTTYHP
eukprot:847048-Ditylum_brightwellii.AAC.1